MINRILTHLSDLCGHWLFIIFIGILSIIWSALTYMELIPDTLQIQLNLALSLLTLLTALLIQYSQNRDTRAIHIKLDEIIRSHDNANNAIMDIEHTNDKTLKEVKDQLKQSA